MPTPRSRILQLRWTAHRRSYGRVRRGAPEERRGRPTPDAERGFGACPVCGLGPDYPSCCALVSGR